MDEAHVAWACQSFGKNLVILHHSDLTIPTTRSYCFRRHCVKEPEYQVSVDRRNIILVVRPLQTPGLTVLARLVQTNATVSDMPKSGFTDCISINESQEMVTYLQSRFQKSFNATAQLKG